MMPQASALPTFRSPLWPLTYDALVGLIACTGLRLREALRLRLDDVDLDHGTLRVARCKYSPERCCHCTIPPCARFSEAPTLQLEDI